jgi:hypothetical protein
LPAIGLDKCLEAFEILAASSLPERLRDRLRRRSRIDRICTRALATEPNREERAQGRALGASVAWSPMALISIDSATDSRKRSTEP